MRGVSLFAVLLPGCLLYTESTDDVPWPDDAPRVDAPTDGPPIDTPPDCGCTDPPPPPLIAARIDLYELDVLDPGNSSSVGQGIFGEVVFDFETDQPLVDTNPGTPFGCKIWARSPAQAAAAGGLDQGTVQLSLPGLAAPELGPCVFASGRYRCPGAGDIIPGLADPGQLPDLQAFGATFTPGPGADLGPFTASGVDVGDDFVLPPTDLARMEAIQRDGMPFSIGCDPAVCTTTTAVATILEIVTTDAPTAGLPATAMPAPLQHQLFIRCVTLADPIIDVPGVFAEVLATATVTRIQTTYRRAKFATPTPAQSNVFIFGGHAIRGFTDG